MSSVTIDADSLRQLVADVRQGNRLAANRLVREHESWVRSAVYAVTGRADLVDDIAQQVWARVWQRLDTLEDPRQLRSWLYAVARNTAIDYSMSDRRRQAQIGRLDEDAGLPDRRPDSPLGALADTELQQTLLRAVQSLPALYREPFVLRHLEEWNYAEIGQALRISVESVETRLVRARRMLREMLQGKVEP